MSNRRAGIVVRSASHLAAAAGLAVMSGHCAAGVIGNNAEWLNASSGNWHDDNRWSTISSPANDGFSYYHVFIEAGGNNYSINYTSTTGNREIRSLLMDTNSGGVRGTGGELVVQLASSITDGFYDASGSHEATFLSSLTIGGGGVLEGNSTVTVNGELSNNGVIRARSGTLDVVALIGSLNLDGSGGGDFESVVTGGGGGINFEFGVLDDDFDGVGTIGEGNTVSFDALTNLWTVGTGGVLDFVAVSGSSADAVLAGDRVVMKGALNVANNVNARLSAPIRFHDGVATIGAGAELEIDGALSTAAGTFGNEITGPGHLRTDGNIFLSSGSLLVSTGSFDMDGSAEASHVTTVVDAALLIEPASFEADGYDGTLNLESGSIVASAGLTYRFDGDINVAGAKGGVIGFAGGATGIVSGDVSVEANAIGQLTGYSNSLALLASSSTVSVGAGGTFGVWGNVRLDSPTISGPGTFRFFNAQVEVLNTTAINTGSVEFGGTGALDTITINANRSLAFGPGTTIAGEVDYGFLLRSAAVLNFGNTTVLGPDAMVRLETDVNGVNGGIFYTGPGALENKGAIEGHGNVSGDYVGRGHFSRLAADGGTLRLVGDLELVDGAFAEAVGAGDTLQLFGGSNQIKSASFLRNHGGLIAAPNAALQLMDGILYGYGHVDASVTMLGQHSIALASGGTLTLGASADNDTTLGQLDLNHCYVAPGSTLELYDANREASFRGFLSLQNGTLRGETTTQQGNQPRLTLVAESGATLEIIADSNMPGADARLENIRVELTEGLGQLVSDGDPSDINATWIGGSLFAASGSRDASGERGATQGSMRFTDQSELVANGNFNWRTLVDGTSSVTANGDLSLGTSEFADGVVIHGALHVGGHTVGLLDADGATLGEFTSIDGGVLASTSGFILGAGDQLLGHGTVSGSWYAPSASSEITVVGGLLNIGSNASDGFHHMGDIFVGDQLLLLNDSDAAEVGGIVGLAGGTIAGQVGDALMLTGDLNGAGFINLDVQNQGDLLALESGLSFRGLLMHEGLTRGDSTPTIAGTQLSFIEGGGFLGSGGIDAAVVVDGVSSFSLTGDTSLTGGASTFAGLLDVGASTLTADGVSLAISGDIHGGGGRIATSGGGAVSLDGVSITGALELAGEIDIGTVASSSKLTIASAISSVSADVDAAQINFTSSGAFTGAGVLEGKVSSATGSIITATGGLTIGDGSSTGVELQGSLSVGSSTVMLLDSGRSQLGTLTTIAGGEIAATGMGVELRVGETISGHGTVARLFGDGGLIEAVGGDLTIGNIASAFGYSSFADIDVGANTVTLLDANAAFAGGTTTLAGGTLATQNGLTFGTITGSGAVDSDVAFGGGGTVVATGAGIEFLGDVAAEGLGAGPSMSGTRVTFADGSSFTGSGHIDAEILSEAGSRIEATGDLTLGSGGISGVNLLGELAVGSHTVTLSDISFAELGALTTIDGGTLTTPVGNLIRVQSGEEVRGFGVIDGSFLAETGAITVATGDLTIGRASTAGVEGNGDLDVGAHTVTYIDLNGASLGTNTSIDGGTLISVHGLNLGSGESLLAHGTIDVSSDDLVLAGALNVGGAARGGFHALDVLGDLIVTSNGAAEFDLGDSGAGDVIAVTGDASLSGQLRIDADSSGYAWGDEWTILSAGSISGDFTSFDMPTLDEGLFWWTEATETDYTIGVRDIADLNADGVVDFSDLNAVLATFGQSGAGIAGDADENGIVDFSDLNTVLVRFGLTAPARAVPAPAALALFGLGALHAGRRRTRIAC